MICIRRRNCPLQLGIIPHITRLGAIDVAEPVLFIEINRELWYDKQKKGN
jgi:hypothetical protein